MSRVKWFIVPAGKRATARFVPHGCWNQRGHRAVATGHTECTHPSASALQLRLDVELRRQLNNLDIAEPVAELIAGAGDCTGHHRRNARATSAPRTAPARTSLTWWTPTWTREYPTAAATGASTAPATGSSRATPHVKAAADAACPLGNDVVQGCLVRRRTSGVSSMSGRCRRNNGFVAVDDQARGGEGTGVPIGSSPRPPTGQYAEGRGAEPQPTLVRRPAQCPQGDVDRSRDLLRPRPPHG